jgi:LysR family transcriptional regulator, hydrogen peroxide-inducible genes activator
MLLRQLKYCVAVHRYGSFTMAADLCCVTQPTLSQQVAELESHLGLQIFDRSKKPVILTGAGKQIVERAILIIEECARLEELAKQLQKS